MQRIKLQTFVILLILLMLPLIVLPLIFPGDASVAGRIHIPEADIRAEVMTTSHGPDCGCCPTLWGGGIATTTADLSTVSLYDTADLTILDGSHYVLECVEIAPCIRVGRWLIGWRGVVKAEGDILLCDTSGHWPVMRVYRWVRL